MKYIFLMSIMSVSFFTKLTAQSNHFLYFQTEDKQPFYIKLDNKIFSSTSSGYVIVPRLKEGNYAVSFGFPKSAGPEQTINLKLDKDAGYIIKNFPGKGWGLFNLQSYSVLTASENGNKSNKPLQEVKDDDFSKMLANVVNDSTIRQKDIDVKENIKEKPKEIAAGKIGIDSTTKQKDIDVKEGVKEKPKELAAGKMVTDSAMQPVTFADSVPVILKSVIVKTLQVKSASGLEMVYTDEYNANKDTIRIFMPLDIIEKKRSLSTRDEEKQQEVEKKDSIKGAAINIFADTLKKLSSTSVFTDSLSAKQFDTANMKAAKAAKIKTVEGANEKTRQEKLEFLPTKSGMINSNCREYANDEDFLKLRKKMVAERDVEDMVKVAKKLFKSKCFSTEYIKKLSVLFLKDEGKYMFYDAAYAYVSDSDIFYTLENQLSDQYYINRFKAMIRK